jgi:2-methylcitrate dehydratase PrpD
MPYISETLAQFVHQLRYEDIPEHVRERAKDLMLDAIGIAFASTKFEFAGKALAGLSFFGGGERAVIGMPAKLALRDAAVMNGVLIHGLDYDDTHLEGVVHASASCFPCALGVAAQVNASGRDLITAYIGGLEAIARIGMVAKGGLHLNGLHPTGAIAAFASSLIAGKLMGLDAEQLVMAQGNALSTSASSSRQYSQEGAWTKRLHPGWGAAAGITAAAMARGGFVGPRQVYEGEYNIYRTHTGTHYSDCDFSLGAKDLGVVWESARVAIKPIPACHLVHACSDAAVALASMHSIKTAEVQSIRALIPAQAIPIVCEPAAQRRRPISSYAAQFSIYHAVAASLVRGKFGLPEMEPAVYNDPAILALGDKVTYEADPQSEYPKYFSGEVIITMKDGRELRRREHINRGAADRPIVREDIAIKYLDNAGMAIPRERAEKIRDMVFGADRLSAPALEAVLAQHS